MKNNNLHKNQPHAQALSDDALENVSGGYGYSLLMSHINGGIVGRKIPFTTPEERQYLEDHGYSNNGGSWTSNTTGQRLDTNEVFKILEDAGFEKEVRIYD